MITPNEVFTRLAEEVNDKTAVAGWAIVGDTIAGATQVYCTRTYRYIGRSLPCIYFREAHYRPTENVTLDYSDIQTNSTVYLEVYARDFGDDLAAITEQAMRDMKYIETSCTQIDNADPSIQRFALSFSRVICEGDTLDEMS